MKRNAIFRITHPNILEHNTSFAEHTWKYWCNSHNCDLISNNAATYSEGVKLANTYTEKYSKIFIIDATAIVKWNCPNIFELVDDRLVGWRDMGDLKSIYNRMQKQDLTRFINYGSIIINSKHKELINNLPVTDTIIDFENVLNNALELVDVNLDITKDFNLNYMLKYDWLSHNWQDGDDKTPFFMKYAYIWRLDNLEKAMYNNLAQQLEAGLKEHYIL